MICIYCLREKNERPSVAHIFPQSIFGDHDELVLTEGQVCGSCNKRLGHKLESAFKDRLGLMPMLIGPGRNKRGTPTRVNTPGIAGSRDPRDPRISINTGKQPARFPSGQRVMPARPGESVAVEHTGDGPDGRGFRLTHELRLDDVFFRALTKIAFETICLHRGAEYCADTRWHRVRAFVLRSEGARDYAVRIETKIEAGSDGWARPPVGISLQPAATARGEEWLAAVTIGATFVMDMSTENYALSTAHARASGEARHTSMISTCRGRRRERHEWLN